MKNPDNPFKVKKTSREVIKGQISRYSDLDNLRQTTPWLVNLTRRWLGGVFPPPPPSGVFVITPKPLQLATRNLAYLILHQLDIEGANFVKIGLQFSYKMTYVTSLHAIF